MKPRLLTRFTGRLRAFAAVVVTAIACLFLSTMLHAGAWTEPAGHGQIILTNSLFRTGTNFDDAGDPEPFAYAGRFHQLVFNPYVEYGVTARNSLIVNANVPRLNFSNQYSSATSAGLGDVELSLKRRLNSVESPWVFSTQFTVLVPAYSTNRNPAPGNHNVDLEGRFLQGRGFTLARRHAFYDLEVGYRYRHGPPADQVRADATLGFDAAHWLTLMGQFFTIKGMRNGEPISANSNPNAQSDFDLYKYQPSLVFNLGRGTRLQFGMNSAFSGRNTGMGHAALLALWKTF